MSRLLLVFLLALAFAAAGTPLVRGLAVRMGLLDRPNARKLQKTPIPLLGGIAIIVGVIGALVLLSSDILGDAEIRRQMAGVLLGSALVAGVGLWDDHHPVPAYVKLLSQFGSAAILIATGLTVQMTQVFWLDAGITLIWVVGITNSINLLDNMDGLSSGVVAVAAAFFALLGALQNPAQFLVGGISAALAGGSLGFWYHNFYRQPATIFMGDVGALFLGFMLAVLGLKLRFPENSVWVTWMVPVLVLGVPIFDTTLVTISRLRRGKNPLTTPGLDHLSHRLVARGLTRREAVLSIYMVCGSLGMMAVFVQRSNALEAYAVAALLSLLAAYALWRLEWVNRVTL